MCVGHFTRDVDGGPKGGTRRLIVLWPARPQEQDTVFGQSQAESLGPLSSCGEN